VSTENSGKNRGNVENLVPHQFKPGESGNPGGRPKKLPITDYILYQLEKPVPASMKAKLPPTFTEVYGDNATFGEMLAFRLVADAANGNMKAIATVLDRAEGKVTQKMALSGEASEPVTFRVIRVNV
jgi:Family of unknown function (DUF5681)